MFYIPKIGDYLKLLTDDQLKDFVAINLGEYFKSMKGSCILGYMRNKILEKLLKHFISF